ncbi:hypothetical protein JKF63_06296 [Porcisia hertigi]|uniref:Uncharacterized protein n=1 Tax=Porcisia hertigi TaxID=2761500 RepID=A0A836IX24_9TRYP|nr:hypothetical protein JKF63_06296 [Porcisia hertigi]
MGNTHTRGGGRRGGGSRGSGVLKSEGSLVAEHDAANLPRRTSMSFKRQESLPSLLSRQPPSRGLSSIEPRTPIGLDNRPRQQQLSSAFAANSTKGWRGCERGKSSDRKGLTAPEKVEHKPHRLSVFRDLSTLTSSASINASIGSHDFSGTPNPRLMANEARDLLLGIFVPREGELECVLSGFLTREDYASMRGFWVGFLTAELRDKWYLGAVMLSVLGKDRWRSLRLSSKVVLSASPTREEVLRLNQRRQECNDQLRELLMILSGSLIDHGDQRPETESLETPLKGHHLHKSETSSTDAVKPDAVSRNEGDDNQSDTGMDSISNSSSGVALRSRVRGATSTAKRQELLILSLMRLQTAVSTSFDCLDLIAARIPTAIISSLPRQYLLNTTPVVYERVAYEEKKIGDLDALSFFVSIESRRRLLNGDAPVDTKRGTVTRKRGHKNFVPATHEGSADRLHTAQQLYSAVRHAGLVLTTACSSLVLTVLFHLADALRERQALRDHKVRAAQLGITLEQLSGRKERTARIYSGRPIENVEEMKQCVAEGEMSLTMFTKQLVGRFRKDNRCQIEQLQQRHANLFAHLETIATLDEQSDFDPTRLLCGITLKLMFLTGGGQRSIVADDRRVPSGVRHITDDVALSRMLEVPILSHICWIACMMGMPIMSGHDQLAQKHQGKPLSFMEIDDCCGVMRVLFQAVGALPCGNACPYNIKDWFSLFPFYAVNSEGKRALMYLYTAQTTAIQRVPLMLKKDMTLLSFATAFRSAKLRSRVDICNYFFEPNFTVGGYSYPNVDSTGGAGSASTSLGPSSPVEKGVHTRFSGTTSEKGTQPLSRSDQPMPLPVNNGSATLPKSVNPGHTASTSATAEAAESRQMERHSSLASLSSSASCSTLMDENLNIDVYTCMNPQAQLYRRCSDEAAMRRHRVTELTPSVEVTFYCSSHDLLDDRPDVSSTLIQALPKLLPSEGLLTLRWTSGEPLVTFCAGDLFSVMAERLDVPEPSGGGAPGSPRYLPALSPSTHHLTSAVTLVGEIKTTSDTFPSDRAGASATAHHSSGEVGVARIRTPLVVIHDHERENSPTGLHGGDGANGTVSEDDRTTLSADSYAAPEMTRVHQLVMHDILGTRKKVNRRVEIQWTVVDVWPCSPSDSANTCQNEVILQVTAPDMLLAVPLRILTIGHERASMSVFTFVSPDDDTVCWSNPNLIDSILDKTCYRPRDSSSSGSNHAVGGSTSVDAAAATCSHLVPSMLLCDTEDALHNVYYSIGVLLGNAITNGVYLTTPIAPLAFLLMKKAISSGDYTFKNFMWLEPADGNLLSPAMVLNAAYEILNMKDHQYVTFLQMRSLDSPESQIFAVIHSLADEIREQRTAQQRSRSHSQASSLSDCHEPRPRSFRAIDVRIPEQPSDKISMRRYSQLIRTHNRAGSTFHRSGCDVSHFCDDRDGVGAPSSLGGDEHLPLPDRPLRYRQPQEQQQRANMESSVPLPTLENLNSCQRYTRLPSRREYISLYLVNDLIWSSVRRDGHGEKNKELWVSMARGFMTSSLAKSPLLTHCCARVIREVLCVPNTER